MQLCSGGIGLHKPACLYDTYRWNDERYELYYAVDIVSRVITKRLRWLSHVVQIEEQETPGRNSIGFKSGSRQTEKVRKTPCPLQRPFAWSRRRKILLA